MTDQTATTINALALCNACDIHNAHAGCQMGYCRDCCPATVCDGCNAHLNADLGEVFVTDHADELCADCYIGS